MRNIMLAATAIVGISALAAGHANAQTPVTDYPVTSNSSTSGSASGITPAPGTLTVRFKALLTTELSYGTDTFSKTATGKNSGVLLGTYARLYPSFVGVAANGLEYGANLEVRENNGATGIGSSTQNTLFFRRYNGYVGTPLVGRIYFGPENNALARLSAGTTMEDFDANGGFNGDAVAGFGSASVANFPYLRGAAFYTNNKIVYISPSFAGFTFGGSWEPSQSTAETVTSTASSLGPQTASIAGGNASRRNTVDFAVQYKGSFGPVALLADVGYIQSAVVNNSTFVQGVSNAKFKPFQAEQAGIRATFGPFAVGGNFNTGALNGNGNGGLIQQGQRNGQNFLVGGQYTIGAVIMGFQYVNQNTGGFYSSNPTYTRSQLHDTGLAIGGAWDYAPGATLFVGAAYDQRHQYGYNFGNGTTNTNVQNSTQGRAIQVGNTFRW